MQFRRSGQRDDRRRRILNNPLFSPADDAIALGGMRGRHTPPPEREARSRTAASSQVTGHKSKNYGDATFMDEQPRLTDLIPTRLSTFALLLVAGLGVVAGLELLYKWMPQLAGMTSDGRVAAFDLDGEGSLAVWFSSITLALAGLVAILIYTIRRHKVDDYQGRYRVWLWAAMCWFLMSIDEAASLHEGFKEMMSHVTGTRLSGDGSLWWVSVYFFLLGAVGSRLLLDMHSCRLSTLAMLATAACYSAAVAAQLGWILPESGARGVMVEEGAEMVGNLMLLMAMGLHARYVILDAQGLLPRRRSWTSRASGDRLDEEELEGEAYNASGRSVTVHPPHGIARHPAPVATDLQPQRSASNADWPVQRKLTKAERKALRKRLMKMRLDRERRQHGG